MEQKFRRQAGSLEMIGQVLYTILYIQRHAIKIQLLQLNFLVFFYGK